MDLWWTINRKGLGSTSVLISFRLNCLLVVVICLSVIKRLDCSWSCFTLHCSGTYNRRWKMGSSFARVPTGLPIPCQTPRWTSGPGSQCWFLQSTESSQGAKNHQYESWMQLVAFMTFRLWLIDFRTAHNRKSSVFFQRCFKSYLLYGGHIKNKSHGDFSAVHWAEFIMV